MKIVVIGGTGLIGSKTVAILRRGGPDRASPSCPGTATASAPMPQQDEAGQAPRGVRGGHERDGTDDPIRELRFNTFRVSGSSSPRAGTDVRAKSRTSSGSAVSVKAV